MCGIAGVYSGSGVTADQQLDTRRMLDALAHRGPDDEGLFSDDAEGITLGHRRLSIIDLSTRGHQPMVSPSGLVLSYNGEIYNFRDVRRMLEKEGATFTTECDTEVLLVALERWGARSLDVVEGMYAFALWNPEERELWLVRDPLGIKPLYWMQVAAGQIAFASEMKPFRSLGTPLQPDMKGIHQYLDLGYVYDPTATAVKNVQKVPPGTMMRFRAGVLIESRRFWTLPSVEKERLKDPEESVQELSNTLETVVQQHLIADVPVGLLLSGGLDSSLVAALAARQSSITTLTMSFGRSLLDESSFAASVAHHIGSTHRHIVIAPEEITDSLAGSSTVVDDLFADWGVVSTRLLYARARDLGMKVVLVGEGADELFGGYPLFARAGDRGSSLRSRFDLYRQYAGKRYGSGFVAFDKRFRNSEGERTGDLFEQVRRFEVRGQLPNNYVMKVDRASMSVSVEARTPFLDRRVADLALRLPRELLMREGEMKWALRQVGRMKGLLPPETARREKFGGSIASSWLDEDLHFRAFAAQRILAPRGWAAALSLGDAMRRYFRDQQEGYRFPRAISIFRNLAWKLLMLELWSANLGVEAPRS